MLSDTQLFNALRSIECSNHADELRAILRREVRRHIQASTDKPPYSATLPAVHVAGRWALCLEPNGRYNVTHIESGLKINALDIATLDGGIAMVEWLKVKAGVRVLDEKGRAKVGRALFEMKGQQS